MAFEHVPVLLQECLQALDIRADGIYVDGTAGGAGHSFEIASRLTKGHLYALDQDPDAVLAAQKRLAGMPATVVHTNFRNALAALAEVHEAKIDGALLDLGVSSHQLDNAGRGFSYRADAPLDMRMSQSGRTAADLVNTSTRQELADILRKYGEEPYAWQIAGKIEKARSEKPIETTAELANLIISSLPPAVRRKSNNPARRTFQAIRIALNEEMDALREGLEELFALLKPGGRLVVITFHSLEDRMVKQTFNEWCVACTCPPGYPICVCGGRAKGKLVHKKPVVASMSEQEENRRSRSAKMRAIEKL